MVFVQRTFIKLREARCWRLMPVIPAIQRQRSGSPRFKASQINSLQNAISKNTITHTHTHTHTPKIERVKGRQGKICVVFAALAKVVDRFD
jgi:hypothetical protein